MKKILSTLGITAPLFFLATTLLAAPVNDNFGNAIALTGPVLSVTGNNIGATKPFGGPGGGEPSIPPPSLGTFGGANVWWTWTATASGPTTIDTQGSDFNTLLGVYTGTAVNTLTLVASSDDYNGNTWSRVEFNAVGGTVYKIQVDGFRSGPGFGAPAMGNIVLNIKGVGGVALDSPTNGMVFTVGDAIPVNVSFTADFPNPPATRVDFYLGGTLFASSTNAPFSAQATNAPAGSNTVYAIAINSVGTGIQSPIANIFVQRVGVTLLTPAEDTVYFNANPIPVSAWAYLPGGAVTNIEFFVDGQKFGEDATAPFAASWTNVVGGSHRLTALGHSDAGLPYPSQPVNIGVASLLVHSNAVWKYLDNGSDQGTNWIAPNFNDSSWASGPAELGYGDGDEATVVQSGPTNNYYVTTYFRRAFVATNVANINRLLLLLAYDDAAAVYLNGHEIYRTANLPTNQDYLTFATGQAIEETVDAAVLSAGGLVEGTNVLAVEMHQQALTSSDISFFLQLSGIPTIIHNLSPIVALTNPVPDAFFLAPPSIPLQATASDPDGTVKKVEFYADGIKVAETTNAGFSASWSNPPVGPHSVTAVAIDDQGARTESAAVAIIVYDAVGTPYVQITAPADGTAVEGGTNILVTTFASAQFGVAHVQFFSNGSLIGDDTTSPFSVVWNAPFGTNALTAIAFDTHGVPGNSAVVHLFAYPNTNAPYIVTNFPGRFATVTNLTNIKIVFSEPVQHVDAGDLLLNGLPATGVTGSGSDYVFTFPQPPYGEVEIAWANGHGITDFGFPADLPFNELGQDAQWEYFLVDKTPPTIAARTPAPGSTVTNLNQISVTFSELVTNVDASDLLVNGTPALSLTGSGSTYVFTVGQPAPGNINITWSTNNGIFDLAETPNPFNRTSGAWTFILDTRVVLVQSNSNWRFVKGFAEASTPTTAWRQPGFDDSSWSNSPAPFFFGDPYTNFPAGIVGTQLSDMASNYTSIFLRHEFVVNNRGAITNLVLNHQSDDGFVAWLNGVEVLRYNVPGGELAYNATAATAANEPNQTGAAYIVATLTNSAVSRLVPGTNILAILALNQSLTNSSDFGFNAQLYYWPLDATIVPPRLIAADPVPGDIFYLTNITVNFSEGVSGVDAADLLVNGVPATGVTSTTNDIYTFSFPQPAYGPVGITWDTNHGIVDFDSPPRAFDGNASSAKINYTLLNPSSPRILTQIPLAGTTVTGLTSVVITFTEPVTGVDASDLLVTGTPASSVTTSDSVTYQFSFLQPAFGTVSIRWATNHGITDIEASPAPFDPTRFGGQWNYTLINPAPSVALTSPANNSFVLTPADVLLRATASDNDGTVALVEFYESAAGKLGDATNSPYTLTVSNVLTGTYIFRAIATDNQGLRGTSAPVVLNVVTSLPVVLVRGPYLQIGSSTGAVVRWRSDIFSDGIVFYGTDPTALTNYAVQVMHTNEHIVPISGLQPETKYFYSVGSSSQRLVGTNGVGSDFFFKTSPIPGSQKPVRMWIVGDSGTAGNGPPDRVNSVRDAFYNLAATNGAADMFLMLGDNAYNSGTDSEYQAAVFDIFPTLLRNTFVWPTIGNHESNQSTTANDYPYLNIFSLPHNGEAGGVPSGTQKYYSFDFANVHLVCLDSETSGYTTNAAMFRWMKDDLAATTQEWVIVFFHHPPYTHGTHNSDAESDLIQIRENWLPVLEDFGVDLVLNGHSHVHERSYLLDHHYGLSSTFSVTNKIDGGSGRVDGTGAYRKNGQGRGVVYNVCGSSGQALGGTLDHPAHFLSLNELGSLVIDVKAGRLDAKFLTTSGDFSDHYTLFKEPLPTAPANLLVRSLGGTDVALSWTDFATNEMGFIIERSTDAIAFTRIATNAPNTTNAFDRGLLANTTYFYRVLAFNSGESVPTSVASITTVSTVGAPLAPTGLLASAGSGGDAYRNQIFLRWTDRSANEAGFIVERSTDGNAFSPICTVGANISSYVDHGLASASYYYYRVRSFNVWGDSTPSNEDGDQTHPQDEVVLAGDTTTFHAGIEGTAPMRYQWRLNGVNLSGATNEALTLVNVQPANEGPYTVVITDPKGIITSNPGWLFVIAPPFIVEQPASRTNVVGSATTLRVTALSSSPLYYQWRKNGTNLLGAASNQLTIDPTTMADQANYDVLVANELGMVTSQVARLVVNQAPLAIADLLSTFKNQPVTGSLAALMANDSDPDGDAITITGLNTNSANGGTINVSGDSLVYSPPSNFSGNDTFNYALTDVRGGTSLGVVTVYVSPNTAPVGAVLPPMVATVLTPFVLSGLATDADIPANKLTFSLVPGPVTNAVLDTNSGTFSWTPTRSQAGTTNIFTVRVVDNGLPPLSNSVSFTVSVNDYIELTAGSLIVSPGDITNVPIDFVSSASLASLQCSLQLPTQRLNNMFIEALAPQTADVLFHLATSNTASLTFNAMPGQVLQGTQHLARLHFSALAAQNSGFAPLRITSLSSTRTVTGPAPTLFANDGRITILGTQPMLEQVAGPTNTRNFVLYGKLGQSYRLEYSTNLANWTLRGSVSLTTNVFRSVTAPNSPAPPIFYRLHQ